MTQFSLATVHLDGAPVGCVERDGRMHRLADFGAPASVAALFNDWPRWSAHLAGATPPAPLPDGLPLLAPLIYPG